MGFILISVITTCVIPRLSVDRVPKGSRSLFLCSFSSPVLTEYLLLYHTLVQNSAVPIEWNEKAKCPRSSTVCFYLSLLCISILVFLYDFYEIQEVFIEHSIIYSICVPYDIDLRKVYTPTYFELLEWPMKESWQR